MAISYSDKFLLSFNFDITKLVLYIFAVFLVVLIQRTQWGHRANQWLTDLLTRIDTLIPRNARATTPTSPPTLHVIFYQKNSFDFRSEFYARKQLKNETPFEYAFKLNRLAIKVFVNLTGREFNRDVIEMLVRIQFVNGLRDRNLRDVLNRSAADVSLQDLIRECERWKSTSWVQRVVERVKLFFSNN